MAVVGKSNECELHTSNAYGECPWPIEYVDPRMERQHGIRDLGPLVVTGHDEYRDPRVSDPLQRDERTLHEASRYSAAEEEVPPVDNKVDFLLPSLLQNQFMVGKKIVTPAPSLDPGSLWQIES